VLDAVNRLHIREEAALALGASHELEGRFGADTLDPGVETVLPLNDVKDAVKALAEVGRVARALFVLRCEGLEIRVRVRVGG
jgi:hypothetical protein